VLCECGNVAVANSSRDETQKKIESFQQLFIHTHARITLPHDE
jgi:hypothetical protein